MKKESYLKSKENDAVKRINFFSDKNTLTVFFLPVFTIPHLTDPLVPWIAVIPLSCQYLSRESESWACSILFETQSKQNEIAALQRQLLWSAQAEGKVLWEWKEEATQTKVKCPRDFKCFKKSICVRQLMLAFKIIFH